MIQIDVSGVYPFLPGQALDLQPAEAAYQVLRSQKGRGGEYTGWLDLPANYDRAEFQQVLDYAAQIREQAQVLVVIGIGGSYLGARATTEFFEAQNGERGGPQILYMGNGLSANAIHRAMEQLKGKDFAINVISKSGTTTEPAIAFRLFKDLLEARYGKEEAARRIYATTDRQKGALREMATDAGYATLVVPDDIGGRYSVLTPVGLLPIAAAGIDIQKLMDGAAQERAELLAKTGAENAAWQYAAARQALYAQGKTAEILAFWEPTFRYMGEWWKQLFGESEGKENKGIYPTSAEFTADLHSLGQYIQQGERMLLETFVSFAAGAEKIVVPRYEKDVDGLNYLAGRELDEIQRKAVQAVKQAHMDGGVPCMEVTAPDRGEESFGALIYFFEFACGVSGYISGVNPFDQPGVEAYKTNMFRLLGKPGYQN